MGTALIAGTGSGAGAASAPAAPVTAVTLISNDSGTFAATSIEQNTLANENLDGPNTGVAAGWSFSLADNWKAGDELEITLAPSSGADCRTPQPEGVNQSHDDPSNYVGFADFNPADDGAGNRNSVVGPAVYDLTDGQTPPVIEESETGAINCDNGPGATDTDSPLAHGSVPFTTYSTLVLTFGNNGANNGSHITINVGLGLSVAIEDLLSGSPAAPVLLNAGFGASTGAVTASGSYIPDGFTPSAAAPLPPAVTVASDATIVGETPAANNPRTGLVRDTSTDAVSGAISNFTITENAANTLPSTNDVGNINPGVTQNPVPVLAEDEMVAAPVPGFACVVIDNHDGSNISWGNVAAGAWTASPGASQASFSAQAGAASVVNDGYTLQLPVTNTSNVSSTVWTATGLSLTGSAYADGPVWAYVYWISGSVGDCSDVAVTTHGPPGAGGGTGGFLTGVRVPP
ncbi:MAG TPA: hypothetical protein VHV57_10820, partial [Acidimicrobiales bacterium]|nr:hypothetical protein [Acidimicrobiales bacterium]